MHNPNNKECPYNATRRGENWAKDGDCHCPPEQKEEWEEELYNLAAINYNLYLSGTCERADTGEDWTFDDARWEIRDFIRTQIALAEERGRRDTITAFVEWAGKQEWLNKGDLLKFADSLKSNLTQKS